MLLKDLLSNKRNMRYKLIYYSSFNPVTIQEISSAWDYKSPTYLYQKESLKTFIENKFLLEEEHRGRKVIRSNMDFIFTKENINNTISAINNVIEFDVFMEFNPTITQEALKIKKYKELLKKILPKDYVEIISRREFDFKEFMVLINLWKNPVFIRAFLSLDIISQFSKNDLVTNPLEFLFKYACGFYELCFGALESSLDVELAIPYELSPFYLEEHLPLIYDNLTKVKKKFSKAELKSFRSEHKKSYNLIVNKFKIKITDEDTPKNWLIKEIIYEIGINGDNNGKK